MSPYKCCANCRRGEVITDLSSIPSTSYYFVLADGDFTGRMSPVKCKLKEKVLPGGSYCPGWVGSTLNVPWEAQTSLGGFV